MLAHIGVSLGYVLRMHYVPPEHPPRGTPWVSPRRPTVHGAGTLDQQKATIERVSKEIGALADLVEANEAKGRMGQVCASALRTMYSRLLTWHSRVL